MDLARFAHSPAGRTVRVRQGNAAYHAFIPAPLPPALQLDAGFWRTLSTADRALGELRGLGRLLPDLLPNPHIFIRPFIHREAVLSSKIEGTRTTLAELYAYEIGQLPLPGMANSPSDDDARKVYNYVLALDHGIERLHSLPLSGRFLRELHRLLMDGVRGEHLAPGEFRSSQNWIGPPGSTLNSATYVPPPVQFGELDHCLDALEKYLHAEDDYPPLIRLAFIHHQFEAIHPFVDGNGRLGRLLLTLLLVNWQLLPAPLLYLSAFFEENRQGYYDLLLAVSERGAWREWVEFFLRGVAEQAEDAVARAARLRDLQREWHGLLREERSSGTLLRLVDCLFASPILTVRRAETSAEISNRTARLGIQRLMAAGILAPVGQRSYARAFVASRILQILNA